MRITFDNVTLRDYQLSDIEDEIRWTNVDTAWFYTDTPWMTLEKVDPDELRADMIQIMQSMPEGTPRWRFEIEVDGHHIGLVSSFYLDQNYEPMPWKTIDQKKNALGNHAIRELGIEICEMDFWGKGIGAKVLTAFMDYYRNLGENRFVLETWSGNRRMLGCAKKLGFTEIRRQAGVYNVGGEQHDAILLEKCFA